MNFDDVRCTIKQSYRTPDNIIDEFYIPLLSRAKHYDRAVGFFSSSILIDISIGLSKLIENQGKIRLITSPRLQEEDIKAIQEGYNQRDIVETAIMREWKEPKSYIEEERLNLLAHLIANGTLDIKIAFKKNGLYHEKFGIITDEDDNKVAFIGSLNESYQAANLNFESIDVYTSWYDEDRVLTKYNDFQETWNNATNSLEVIEFPKVAREKLEKYKRDKYIINIDEYEKEYNNQNEDTAVLLLEEKQRIDEKLIEETEPNTPKIPPINENFKGLHDYQTDAIEQWSKQDYRGIFDMATGTGKTYTGLGAIVDLYNHTNHDLAVVICCPFMHLVDQWVEDIRKFNIKPIIGHSASEQSNWKNRLENAVQLYNRNISKNNFFCFICTNDTFRSSFVQEQILQISHNTLFMADEAHYFGARILAKSLPDFDYRLALSATVDRHGDKEGTQLLYSYFGDKCIEYDIRRAIKEEKLTKYYYYPHTVLLDADEMDEYKRLSFEIKKYHLIDDKEPPEAVKKLLIARSRILASARNKLSVLRELLEEQKKNKHILVYCGDSVVAEHNSTDYNASKAFGEKQIKLVCEMMGRDLNMDIARFTSQESAERRQEIKRGFMDGSEYQAIVAIKCLDEGFNIPAITTAYILASTTNPKQYIQRRGRVLRTYNGKQFAYIHDFVVLPRDIDMLMNASEEELKLEVGLVKRELSRVEEFASLAENSSAIYNSLINPLQDGYHLNDIIVDVEEFE